MSRAAAAPASVESTAPVDATKFLRPHLLKLAAYTPIEPFEILSKRYGRAPQDIIKLDANENPYGPPPEVLQALSSMPFPHIYPDPETRALRKALAEMNNVPIENILVGGAIGALAAAAGAGRGRVARPSMRRSPPGRCPRALSRRGARAAGGPRPARAAAAAPRAPGAASLASGLASATGALPATRWAIADGPGDAGARRWAAARTS